MVGANHSSFNSKWLNKRQESVNQEAKVVDPDPTLQKKADPDPTVSGKTGFGSDRQRKNGSGPSIRLNE